MLLYVFCFTVLLRQTFAELPSGFVYLYDIAPDIQVSLRYHSQENFMGRPINGYEANISIMTKAAAIALQKAQTLAKNDGFELVVYDSYRPQKSVTQFGIWSKDPADQMKKQSYYPRINKLDAFDLGYIAEKSGHTRGSTIDLTLIPLNKQVTYPLQRSNRTLADNYSVWLLDDGTMDMGSSFDLFDQASHTNSTLVNSEYQRLRAQLKTIMETAGFSNYPLEWWHYTLNNEPFPDTYFDFNIEALPPNSVSRLKQSLNLFLILTCVVQFVFV